MLRIILLIFLSIEYAKSRHADLVFEKILSIDSSIFKAFLCLPTHKTIGVSHNTKMVFIRTPFRRQSNQQRMVLIQINTILVLIQTCINTKMVFLQTPFRRQSNQQQLVLIQINTILVLIQNIIYTIILTQFLVLSQTKI